MPTRKPKNAAATMKASSTRNLGETLVILFELKETESTQGFFW